MAQLFNQTTLDRLVFDYGPARPHPRYAYWLPIWCKCRDVLAGEEAVKAAGEVYLPRMDAMNDAEYDGYKTRALFYGASFRTLQGLMGALLRKEPILHVVLGNEAREDALKLLLEPMLKNVTQTGVTLQAFTRDLVEEILSVGRVGLLVDMPSDVEGVTAQPYVRLYKAEHIVNWRETYVNGVPVVDQVILQEEIERPSVSGFGSDWIVQYRELALDEQGFYVQRIYVIDPPETDQDEPYVRVTEEHWPTFRGKKLTDIPFSFISASHMRPEVARPPLLDLYNANLSHYRSSADLEHGRHFTALPTPWVNGVEDEDQDGRPTTLRIGSGTAWLLPENAQARMLEFNGQGLKHLENALAEKQQQMVSLGARMLEQDKRASETAEAMRLRQAGDIATLNVLSDTVSAALTRAVRTMAWWAGMTRSPTEETITLCLDKDFYESRLSSHMIIAMVGAWQAGAMSWDDLYDNFVRGEIIDPKRDKEDVRAQVEGELRLREQSILATKENGGVGAKGAPTQ